MFSWSHNVHTYIILNVKAYFVRVDMELFFQ